MFGLDQVLEFVTMTDEERRKKNVIESLLWDIGRLAKEARRDLGATRDINLYDDKFWETNTTLQMKKEEVNQLLTEAFASKEIQRLLYEHLTFFGLKVTFECKNATIKKTTLFTRISRIK